MAAVPAGSVGVPQRLAARRGAALRGLDRRLRMGEDRAARFSRGRGHRDHQFEEAERGLLTNATSMLILYVFALVFGLSLGSRGVSLGAFTANTFPGREFGAIYGWITLGQLIGGSISPWLGGILFDALGNYRPVFYGCLVGFALSALLVVLAAIGQKHAAFRVLAATDDEPNPINCYR
jgi:hypothetical protein